MAGRFHISTTNSQAQTPPDKQALQSPFFFELIELQGAVHLEAR
jgi:hypothetical protein